MIDTHAHLNDSAFDQDREAVIERAREAGVEWMMDVTEDISSARKSLNLFENSSFVGCAVGLHPHVARVLNSEELKEFSLLIKNPQVKGIGEIGLDYYYEKQPPEIQKKAFQQMLDLSVQAHLPVFIHNRDSDQDLLEILRMPEYQSVTGIIHCFTSTWETADALLNLGFYISFSGIVTFKKAEDLRDVVKKIPLEKIFFETDAPYLTPEPYRGKRNEPSFIKQTAQEIARIKGVSLDKLQGQIRENANSVFKM